jgi:hypothetical protein
LSEEFIFYNALERALPQMLFDADTAERLAAIEAACLASGTEIGRLNMPVRDFAYAFERIGAALGVGDKIAQGAIAFSPHRLMPSDDMSWRMGFFGVQTVELIQAEIGRRHDALAALDSEADFVRATRNLFLASCEEASATGQAIVIIHADC